MDITTILNGNDPYFASAGARRYLYIAFIRAIDPNALSWFGWTKGLLP